MEQITVGLDFGTHQTKICIECKDGAELGYHFVKFRDTHDSIKYTLPSIIQINANGTLEYGYINKRKGGQIVRYFKQATFTSSNQDLTKEDACLYSIWYISNILFDLEEKYQTNFNIQMGVPSDSSHLESQRQLAVSILLSAYTLVEDVFANDKDAFLKSTVTELREKTKVITYSDEKKEEYQILVFPEAYACLMPLVTSSKIPRGMSLMVDIGGGTTDISFFSMRDDVRNPKKNELKIHYFQSIDKGLNFLTQADILSDEGRTDSNIRSTSELNKSAINVFKSEINNICSYIQGRLYKEFKDHDDLPYRLLKNALRNRPIVYTGGGSCFDILCGGYHGFQYIIHLNQKNWKAYAIEDWFAIVSLGICPILSTAYGLSISQTNDNVICESLQDVFNLIRRSDGEEYQDPKSSPKFGHAIGGSHGFNYMDDFDAWK